MFERDKGMSAVISDVDMDKGQSAVYLMLRGIKARVLFTVCSTGTGFMSHMECCIRQTLSWSPANKVKCSIYFVVIF